MNKFILGTVQLGLNYGVNNLAGKPTKEESFHILDAAKEQGIQILDTAYDYGDSEAIIGEYIKNNNCNFLVSTKLSSKLVLNDDDLFNRVMGNINESMERLNIEKIELFYLHSFKYCKNIELMKCLSNVKKIGKINKIGVSIYEPLELEYILCNLTDEIDVVQIPFNILDSNRWMESKLLCKVKKFKIEIYARSIYLQGLIFKSIEDVIVKSLNAVKYIEFLNLLSFEKKCSIQKLAYDFVSYFDEIDGIIIGCENVTQLLDNSKLKDSKTQLSCQDIQKIREFSFNIDNKIIDPRKWGC